MITYLGQLVTVGADCFALDVVVVDILDLFEG